MAIVGAVHCGMEAGLLVRLLTCLSVTPPAYGNVFTVFPRLVTRTKRESHLGEGSTDLEVQITLDSKPLHLLLAENQALSLGYGVIEWVHPNGSVTKETIMNVLKRTQAEMKEGSSAEDSTPSCFYSGIIRGEESSIGSTSSMSLYDPSPSGS